MRTIVHLDADAFFASVEQAADARLRGKPIAVGGESRGIIASASYEARKFGVYTPMPTARARKLCPRLIVLPGDYERYEQFSNWMFGYAYDFTPDVEQTSIDEGYFDITANHSKPSIEIALTISQAIRQSLKITVSEGLASNKLVSQIASKLHKPAGFETVPPGGEKRYLQPLPNRWLPGIGPKASVRLNAAGLAEIGQIAAMPVDLLELLVGQQAPVLRLFANGIDERPLIPARAPQKSYSQQETFAEDVTDEEYIEAVLRRMADKLFAAVREECRSVRTLTVKVRYNDRDENQRAESLREPTDLETDVYGRLRALLRQAWQRRVSLRMVSLKLSNVYDGVFRSELPLEAHAINHAARERLAVVLDNLRRNKGWSVVLRGHDLRLKDTPAQLQSATGGQVRKWESEKVGVASKRVFSLSHLPTFSPARSAAYIPLRVRSHYTFLDSTLSPTAIVNLAKQHGLPAIAMTDLSNLHGAVEFAEAAKKTGIKPIFGTELRVGEHPLLLYVESARGYHNLNRLLSKKVEGGMQNEETAVAARQRAPVTETFLQRHAGLLDGLLAVSSDTRLVGFFPGRFYQLAGSPLTPALSPSEGESGNRRQSVGGTNTSHSRNVLPHPNPLPLGERESSAVTREYRESEMAGRFSADRGPRRLFPSPGGRGIKGEGKWFNNPARSKLVACPAIHYALPEDRLKYDILQSIRTRTLLRQEHPEKRRGGRFHFRTPVEMAAACKDHPDWLAHSLEIAERCNFDMPFGKPQFPPYTPKDGSTPREFLHKLVFNGARRRYHPSQLSTLNPQLHQELNIIAAVGYEEYFLVVWNILQDCHAHGIEWITRGSAADSLVCYCLGISDVCPIRFGLYFRRFLNEERMALNKLPDIDVDFPHDRKDDVVDLIFAKYGGEHCAVVGGFSTFQARSAFADVAKVLGVAEREVRRFTEHFPWSFGGGWVPDEPTPGGGAKLREMLAAGPENRDLPLDEEPFKTALDMAEFLDGMPRNPKMHPCGVVLSRQPMQELTPTFISNKGYPTTHYDMDAVEVIGLVKIDVLAQGGLAAIRDVKAMLTKRGVKVDLERCVAVESEKEKKSKGENETHFNVSVTTNKSGAQNDRTVLPHPGPLPPGEGESSAVTGEGRESEIAGRLTANGRVRLLSPSPSGRGIKGEGESRDNPPRPRRLSIAEHVFPLTPALSPWERENHPPSHVTSRDGGNFNDSRIRAQSTLLSPPPEREGQDEGEEPWNDPAVWEMIATGNARAVHHIESPAMTGLCKQCNARDIDTLIAIVSVIRPGAANQGKKLSFTRRYQGLEPITCPHPSLEPVLRDTFGLVVYEEHILQICEAFAGLNPGRADVLRRALNKQKRAVIAEIRDEFFASARSRGHALEKIEEVWGLVAGFAGYAFCKAHSTAYGVEAYQAAWLKRYFPAEFMAAVLTNGKGFYDPLVYVLEAWRLGIQFLPPTVNAPGPEFKAEGRMKNEETSSTRSPASNSAFCILHSAFIRVPLTRAKGLTERTTERLLAERARGPFTSMEDFYQRVQLLPEEMEILIRAGGFDEFGQTRTRQFWEAQYLRKAEGKMQNAEFDFGDDARLTSSFKLLPAAFLREPTRHERLEAETELFGYAVSGHPLELFADIAWETYCPVARLGEHLGQTVVTCGLVVEQRTHHQITGEPMKFLTLADWTGMVETELFAQTYKSYGLATVRYPVLEVTATVEPFENGRGFSLRVLRAGKPRVKQTSMTKGTTVKTLPPTKAASPQA